MTLARTKKPEEAAAWRLELGFMTYFSHTQVTEEGRACAGTGALARLGEVARQREEAQVAGAQEASRGGNEGEKLCRSQTVTAPEPR